ncbi:MAG TPA: Smr/MutS family protein [Dissulfurispiraceae bacterium]|nr:Smr/MutS family protein [Dissulfurispiraceae bacterium]
MPNQSSLSDEAVFAQAMQDVREIPEFRSLQIKHRKREPVHLTDQAEPHIGRILREITQGKRPLPLEQTQEYVSWLHPQALRVYPPTLLQNLHSGAYSVQDYIDLHGMTSDIAEGAFDQFLRHALLRGFRCIKIIHGRGLRSASGPVLKERIIVLLQTRYAKHIVAFVTARPSDGGLGALYALLRRKPFRT